MSSKMTERCVGGWPGGAIQGTSVGKSILKDHGTDRDWSVCKYERSNFTLLGPKILSFLDLSIR